MVLWTWEGAAFFLPSFGLCLPCPESCSLRRPPSVLLDTPISNDLGNPPARLVLRFSLSPLRCPWLDLIMYSSVYVDE